jgi:drug/metabolite transporter (DMT)-like permease
VKMMTPIFHRRFSVGVVFALLAAVLFGASTPFSKTLLREVDPILLAGLLYLSSGSGLTLWQWLRLRLRPGASREANLKLTDLPWLAGAILSGGIIGPVLLMIGLARTPASTASLLLNLEGVFTALLAGSFSKRTLTIASRSAWPRSQREVFVSLGRRSQN